MVADDEWVTGKMFEKIKHNFSWMNQINNVPIYSENETLMKCKPGSWKIAFDQYGIKRIAEI